MRRVSVSLLSSLFSLLPLLLHAQPLQSPAQFLGYELGERFTPHHRVVDYFEHVAQARPDAVRLVPYGETYEGRPLMVAFISSPENMARLEQIRESNLQRAGLMDGTPSPDQPAIVWLSYNVHGNESTSSEAALATLYDLANPNDARTQGWLQNVVVAMDPMENPDGRERYVNWYKMARGAQPNPKPEAREHQEPWPGGRTNHYYFDLNRDWAWQTQKESKARAAMYQQWMPQVHVDLHEQGVNNPYYFAPAAEPFHEAITPWQREFQTRIGENHMRYFDEQGWLYFTREVFDLFYPSYGDTWPTFQGAIGMTYEQGGSGFAGLAVITALGDTLTLRDRINGHHTTSLSTVEVTAQHRARALEEFTRYFRDAQQNPPTPYAAYVIKGNNPPQKIAALIELLEKNGIRYGTATAARRGNGFDYTNTREASVAAEAGDLVIPAQQPRAVMTRVLFEPASALVDSLTYDITAWALPYVYGLNAVALREPVTIRSGYTFPSPAAMPATPQAYAYLADWDAFADAQLLAELIKRDVRVRFSEQPFEMDGKQWNRGTLLVTRRGNEQFGNRLPEVLNEAARAASEGAAVPMAFTPALTGYVTSGQDFGSSGVRYVGKPKVALVWGASVSSGSLGQLWHYFDQQLRYPVTLINGESLGNAPLDDYDVLILPSGFYGSVLNDARLGRVREWVRAGGTLIALPGAAGFLAGKEGFDLKRKSGDEARPDSLRRYADREREAISGDIPGAIYRARLDNTHPLAFGYPEHYFTLKLSGTPYDFLGTSGWNVATLGPDAHVSGFVGADVRERLDNTLVAGVQDMGQGQVVYFLDDPTFRAFWENGKLMLANAVFMVGR